VDVARFNADWLQAWTEKEVDRLLGFYAADTVYKDGQTAEGLRGHEQLGPYLRQLFTATPPMRYDADAVWPIEGGFCGRWICTIEPPGGNKAFIRGFDLVLLRDGKIALNEVYTHQLKADPRA
jgi:hypothetical protein